MSELITAFLCYEIFTIKMVILQRRQHHLMGMCEAYDTLKRKIEGYLIQCSRTVAWSFLFFFAF